jgi:chromatin segregation and condensation protein Rec8/ScpA/Scc1 (kleisin family)
VARLVAYAPFQRAAHWLAERLRAAQGPRYRRVPPGTAAPVPVRDDPARLRAAMEKMVEAPPAPSLEHMGVRRRPLPELLGRLRESLARLREVSFDQMVSDCDRLEEALTLLAALEMVRRGEAELRQDVPFGDILIRGTRA